MPSLYIQFLIVQAHILISTESAVMYKAFRLLILKRLSGALKHPFKIHRSCHLLLEPSRTVNVPGNALSYPSRSIITAPRNFCSRPSNLDSDFQAPTSIDYRYVVTKFLYLNYLLVCVIIIVIITAIFG